jgi:hypothetical protein
VVEGNAGAQREEATGDARPQAAQGAGAVALEGENVLRGPVDALDSLARRGQVEGLTGLVLAARPQNRRAGGGSIRLEVGAGVALVAEDRDGAAAIDSPQ